MAKGKDKEHKKLHQVYQAGDKFHCGECGTEVDYGKNCPMCKKELNWVQVEANIRR